MSGRVKFVPDSRAVDAFLRGPEATSLVRQAAASVTGRCGDGFKTEVSYGSQRVNAIIWTGTSQARRRQASEHTLERAVGGGL